MNIFGVGIHGKETGKIREVFRILKAMKEKNQFVPIVVIENVLNILSAEAMKYLIEAFSELEYDYLAWRTVDLLGALPHSRNRVVLVATRDGINPHDILFEANPECECEKVRTGEEKNWKRIFIFFSCVRVVSKFTGRADNPRGCSDREYESNKPGAELS
jgi:site-specific DNA-cytosine methylase